MLAAVAGRSALFGLILTVRGVTGLPGGVVVCRFGQQIAPARLPAGAIVGAVPWFNLSALLYAGADVFALVLLRGLSRAKASAAAQSGWFATALLPPSAAALAGVVDAGVSG